MNKIINLVDVKVNDNDGRPLLRNVNLEFNEGENTCIYSKSDNEFLACQKLVDVLSGASRCASGDITFSKFNDSNRKYIFGHRNFANIFSKDVKPIEVIYALFKKESIIESNQNEILEIANFLGIDSVFETSMLKLTNKDKQLFNLLFLLTIKPRILFLDNLSLVGLGSTNKQIAILNFFHEYLNKYNITLIMSSNDPLVRKELCQRFIEIDQQKIANDNSIKIQKSIDINTIDNKTKAFDLDSELSLSLSSSSWNDNNPSSSFYNRTAKQDDFQNIKKTTRNKFDTASISTEFDKVFDRNNRQYQSQRLSNFPETELRTKTQELKLQSDDLIQEIKLHQSNQQKHMSSHSYANPSLVKSTIKYDDDDEIIQDLIDTYIIRKQLEKQIKSPDFIKLSVDLQNKVFENYERAQRLIKENDPTGIYDPNRTSNLDFKSQSNDTSANNGFTRMILSEELGLEDNQDQRIKNIYKTKTSEINVDDIESKQDATLNSILNDVSTDELFETEEEEFDFNKKPSNPTMDYRYHDNAPKKSLWNRKFRNHSNDQQDRKNNEFMNSHEPTRNTTEKLRKEISNNLQNRKTAKFASENYEPSYSKPKVSAPLKTRAIKTRSKKNKIEQLYEEGLADKELAKDLKESQD